MKNKTTLFFALLIIVVIALIAWARATSEPRESVGYTWPGSEVQCLLLGHQNLAQHIHPVLAISVDGVPESIPSDIGVTDTCMAETHTHDGSGELHIESVAQGKTFTILDFFSVWGRGIDREGYTYQMFVNGEIADPNTYVLSDLDQIEIRYTTEGREPVDAPATQSDVDFNLKL